MKKHILILLSAAVTLLLGCTREEDRIPENQGIRFRVSAGSDAIPTKTLYSGDTYDVGAGVYKERIDWSAGDRISIYCPESSGDKVGIYSIGGAEDSTPDPDEKSHASGITSVDGKLQWGGATKYNFYARYPDPSWSTGLGTPYAHSAFSSQGANSTSFLCYLPATQTVTQDGSTSTYLPEMKYCYMTASALNVDKLADDITLSFSPAVNTLEITIPNDYSSGTFTISELKLVSASHRLNGEYSINVATGAATVSETSLVEADRTITLDFGGDITVDNGGELTFTVFTCPVALNDITLYLTLDDGYVRTLPLKYETSSGSGSYTWLSFDAFKKYRVNCSTVADPYIYEIRTDVTEVTTTGAGAATGGTATVKMASTKNKLGVITASPWKAQYSTNGTSWTDLTASNADEAGISLSAYTGSGDPAGEDVTVTLAAGTIDSVTGAISYKFLDPPADNSEKGNAIDLSFYNFLTNSMEGTRETANCYIIRAPGWYKFPLVYGNAVKNGAVNTGSFTCQVASKNATYYSYMGTDDGEINFVDGKNRGIMSSTYPKYKIEDATTVGIVWQDAVNEVIIRSSGDNAYCIVNAGDMQYVYFYVPADKIQPCNVVLKVMDSSSNTIWSWHIWMVPSNEDAIIQADPSLQFGAKAVTNYSNVTHDMLTMNLGQLPPISGTVTGYAAGTYYIRFVSSISGVSSPVITVTRPLSGGVLSDPQGKYATPCYETGRISPLLTNCGGNSNGERTKRDWDYSTPGLLYKGDDTFSRTSQAVTDLSTAIANPAQYYGSSNGVGSGWWYSTAVASLVIPNMWDTSCQGGYGTVSPVKSVYDPSPRGFRVSVHADFTGFTSYGTSAFTSSDINKVGSWNRGYYLKCNSSDEEGIFFAASGKRDYGGGSISNVGSYACAGHSGASNNANYTLFMESNRLYPVWSDAPTYCYPIRPVRE